MADGASPGRGYGALEVYLPTSPLAPVPDTARARGPRAPMGGDVPGAGARSRTVVPRRTPRLGNVQVPARAQSLHGRPLTVLSDPHRGRGLPAWPRASASRRQLTGSGQRGGGRQLALESGLRPDPGPESVPPGSRPAKTLRRPRRIAGRARPAAVRRGVERGEPHRLRRRSLDEEHLRLQAG